MQAFSAVAMDMGMTIWRRAIGCLRGTNFCEWSNHDHRVSFCVQIFSSYGWKWAAITFVVKVSPRHVFCESAMQVSSYLVSGNDERAQSIAIHVFLHSSNAELRAFFPDDLGEVTCTAWLSSVKVIARIAHLIVPIKGIVKNIFQTQ